MDSSTPTKNANTLHSDLFDAVHVAGLEWCMIEHLSCSNRPVWTISITSLWNYHIPIRYLKQGNNDTDTDTVTDTDKVVIVSSGVIHCQIHLKIAGTTSSSNWAMRDPHLHYNYNCFSFIYTFTIVLCIDNTNHDHVDIYILVIIILCIKVNFQPVL